MHPTTGDIDHIEQLATAAAIGLLAHVGPDLLHVVIVATVWLIAQAALHEYKRRRPPPDTKQ